MDPGGPKLHFKPINRRNRVKNLSREKWSWAGQKLQNFWEINSPLGAPPEGPEPSVALYVARKLFGPSGKSAIIVVDDTGSLGPNMAVNSPFCGTSRAQTP